jgi:hypothetical protein
MSELRSRGAMKTGIINALIIAIVVGLFTTAGATQGFADRYRHGHGGYHGHGHHGYHYRYRGHHRDGDYALGLVLLPFAYLFGYSQGQYDSGRHYGSYDRAWGCHPVVKVDYDRFGRRAKFGGTMCYNDYGEPFIVPGSRHIIYYYY